MRRIGGEYRSIHRANRGTTSRSTGRALGLALLASSAARAGDGGPILAPPTNLPAAAPTPTTPRAIVSSPAASGPVLALPGFTPPPPRASEGPATLAPSTDASPPALDAPIEMRNAPPATRSAISPMIESIPDQSGTTIARPATRTGPAARRGAAPPASTATPAVPPPRRPWFFGGPRPGTAPATSSASKPATDGSGPAGPEADPAAEAALKRKIERQARAAIGDRARSLEVRVVGKQATIEARGVRLMQKRGVRKALEALPALSGLRSSIAVLD